MSIQHFFFQVHVVRRVRLWERPSAGPGRRLRRPAWLRRGSGGAARALPPRAALQEVHRGQGQARQGHPGRARAHSTAGTDYNLPIEKPLYRVTMEVLHSLLLTSNLKVCWMSQVVVDLGWVDFNLDVPPSCPPA